MKILHIINSLKKGGAEGNLYRLCKFQKKKYKENIKITIITLIRNGYYELELKKMGVKIFSLDISKKNKLFNFIGKIKIFRNLITKENPNIIQSWMYHSNFISLFTPKIKKRRIFWNIRHSDLNLRISKKITICLSFICGFFSRVVPKKIIYCSEKSIKFHEKKHFYSKHKTVLIDNGYSDKIFFKSNTLRSIFRKKNNIKEKDIILGYAGRYAKQKNINSLLKAFSKIVKNNKNTYLYMVGKDINQKNKELTNVIHQEGLRGKIFLLKEQKNLLKFYNGIDFLVLVSHSESFPNVVAESMLCSTPVLSSDAGCSKRIINEKDFVIKKNDYLSIASGLKKMIKIFFKKNKWNILKKSARVQIQKNFSLEKMSNKYFENWIF